MKIIDKNKDFYDYYQGIMPDDTFTFDRRDSYELSKEEFARSFTLDVREGMHLTLTNPSRNRFILLQVSNTFWLCILEITKTVEESYRPDYEHRCVDYNLKLLESWKNYDTKRELIKLSAITFGYTLFGWDFWRKANKFNLEKIDDNLLKNLVEAIKQKDYNEIKVFNDFTILKDNKEEKKHIPILKNLGFASIIDPKDIYLSLEEYFSKEKDESERTESIGLTDKDKIVNHGFDIKTSFRGKNQ